MNFKPSLLLYTLMTFTFATTQSIAADETCIAPAQWYNPAKGKTTDGQMLLSQSAQSPVVLLGEQHENGDHHRWQLHTIAGLYALNPNMVLGFEMFPRRLQPILDQWVRGAFSEKEFLEKSEWDIVWRFDAKLYMPIFHFARLNHLPMVALNVDRSLVSAVSTQGWDKVAIEVKEGVKKPAPAQADYLASLKDVYNQHAHFSKKQPDESKFNRFVEAQLTWDGAMAQKIAEVQKSGGNPLVVSIMGSGHLQNRWGVPHQLKHLGLNSTVLIPWSQGRDCADLTPSYADAVFAIDHIPTEPEKPKPRLGVMIETAPENKGVTVIKVTGGSIAQSAGIQDSDVIVKAAGQTVSKASDLITIIQRQAPGTWLPLVVRRQSQTYDIIAKIPN